MLGAAQTAALSSWWTPQGGDKSISADMTLTFTVDILQPTLISPRYSAEFDTATSNAIQMFSFGNASGTGKNMNMTGVVDQPLKTIHGLTLRPGQDFLASAPTSGYVDGIRRFVGFNNNGTQNFFVSGIFKDNNQYIIGWNGLNPVSLSAAEFDSRRDHWFGITIATSNASSSFADWTDGPDNGSGLAARTVVFDITANELLGVNDSWFYSIAEAANIANIDLSQQWTTDYQSTSYFTTDFISWQQAGQVYDRKDCEVGSHWFAIGETIDPKTYYKDFIGWGLTGNIQGIQAWQYWLFDTAGTAQTGNVTWGYDHPMGTGSRYPTTGLVRIATEFNTTNPPEFVKIS